MEFLLNLDVDDLDKAIRFYRDAFGLKPARRLGGLAVEMVGGPAPIYLLAKASGTPPSSGVPQPRTYRRHWTPLHLDFVVDEIDAAVARALAAGARLEQPVAEHEWGKLALLADPFGHGFCFVQFLGRGYDAIAK
jgi:catechol 2,3-dioxygenase-like lactoylglutathione lyase family enzyme